MLTWHQNSGWSYNIDIIEFFEKGDKLKYSRRTVMEILFTRGFPPFPDATFMYSWILAYLLTYSMVQSPS